MEAQGFDRCGIHRRRGNVAVSHGRLLKFLLMLAIAAIVAAIGLFSAALHAADLPVYSVRYRAALERSAAAQFGLNAPVARLAAQIHEESGWRPNVASAYAQGLAQFTPETAKWLPQICPEVGEPDPWDAAWSIRAIACYDHYLYAKASAVDDCNRWAFTLSDYNGGIGMRQREQRAARAVGADATRWFGGMEGYRVRSVAAWRENRGYVRDILLDLEPQYLAAGWPGSAVCVM